MTDNQCQPDTALEREIEQILFGRIMNARLEGYTVETARQIMDLIAAHRGSGVLTATEARWGEDELALAFFDYSACKNSRCTFDPAKPCPCATEAYKAVHWIKHVLPNSLPLRAASPLSSADRGRG